MDVAAGLVVGSIGVESLRHVHRPQELLLASLPLAFGAHQFTEAFVWWGLTDRVAPSTGHTALWVYMTFAFMVLPLLAPVAVLLVEPDAGRRRLVAAFAAVGGAVALVYARAMLGGPISASIHGRTLSYRTGVAQGGVVAAVYMVACVGALLSSSHRHIAAFGAANLVALPVLTLMATRALTSLWCVWAAVASVIIANHQRLSDTGDAEEGHGRPVRHSPAGVLSDWVERAHFRPR